LLCSKVIALRTKSCWRQMDSSSIRDKRGVMELTIALFGA